MPPLHTQAVKAYVERAWSKGWDPMGALTLNSTLVGTTKWVGTMEAFSLFDSFGVPCRVVSFLADDDPRLNTRGGAIAIGHPLGMSGARLVLTAFDQLRRGEGKRALCTMCIGVGQGISLAIERL